MGKTKKKVRHKVDTQSEYDRNRLFHRTENSQGGVTQTTTVSVTVNPEKESSCWDGLKACFGMGRRAAGAAS